MDENIIYGNWDFYESPEEKKRVKKELIKWQEFALKELNKNGILKVVESIWIESSYPRKPSYKECTTLGLRLEVHERNFSNPDGEDERNKS